MRQPVRGQIVQWCECGDWHQSEKDQREHKRKCPGPMLDKRAAFLDTGSASRKRMDLHSDQENPMGEK